MIKSVVFLLFNLSLCILAFVFIIRVILLVSCCCFINCTSFFLNLTLCFISSIYKSTETFFLFHLKCWSSPSFCLFVSKLNVRTKFTIYNAYCMYIIENWNGNQEDNVFKWMEKKENKNEKPKGKKNLFYVWPMRKSSDVCVYVWVIE